MATTNPLERRVYMREYMRLYRAELKRTKWDPARYPSAAKYREAVLRAIRVRHFMAGHPEWHRGEGVYSDVDWQYAREQRQRDYRRRGERGWWERRDGKEVY
jgi:hypothetical protein